MICNLFCNRCFLCRNVLHIMSCSVQCDDVFLNLKRHCVAAGLSAMSSRVRYGDDDDV